MWDEPGEVKELEQFEFVWILPRQYALIGHRRGFALRIDDFLGPGDPDLRGRPRVWVRGAVLGAKDTVVTVLIPHSQPRARRGDGRVGEPEIPREFDLFASPSPPAPGTYTTRYIDTNSGPPSVWYDRIDPLV